MGNSLDTPNIAKEGEKYQSSTGLDVGASGMQGWRLEMEDSHIACDIPSKADHLFLAVFDGHAGAGAAKYASQNMVSFLEKSSEWNQYVENGCDNIELLGDALIHAFVEIDERMKAHQETTYGKDTSGCTAVACVVTPKYIICANSGDSRCVMGTNGVAKALSDDHKPYNEVERKRIEAAGGFVQWNRVDGDLAVSRALGDFSYKNRPDLPPKDQKITCYPDLTIHERNSTDDVLLLACDGLWDVMSTSEAVDLVREIYQSGETCMMKIAEELLDISLDKGSKDNISSTVVRLPGAVIGSPSNGGVDGRRQSRLEAQRARQEAAIVD